MEITVWYGKGIVRSMDNILMERSFHKEPQIFSVEEILRKENLVEKGYYRTITLYDVQEQITLLTCAEIFNWMNYDHLVPTASRYLASRYRSMSVGDLLEFRDESRSQQSLMVLTAPVGFYVLKDDKACKLEHHEILTIRP